jgi:hypothetical protein
VWKKNFKSKGGLFKWLVVPIFLTNAPTTFMRLMDDVFRPFTNSFFMVYLDEILIFNRTWEEHIWHIQQVLITLWKHKLYENLKKCSFFMNRVQYLGYIVEENGVHVDSAKFQLICDWTAPTTLTTFWRFLGLTNFDLRFMLGLLHIAWALI